MMTEQYHQRKNAAIDQIWKLRSCQALKKFDKKFSRFGMIPECDSQTDIQRDRLTNRNVELHAACNKSLWLGKTRCLNVTRPWPITSPRCQDCYSGYHSRLTSRLYMASSRYLSTTSRTFVSTSIEMSRMFEIVRNTNFSSSRLFGLSSRSSALLCRQQDTDIIDHRCLRHRRICAIDRTNTKGTDHAAPVKNKLPE